MVYCSSKTPKTHHPLSSSSLSRHSMATGWILMSWKCQTTWQTRGILSSIEPDPGMQFFMTTCDITRDKNWRHAPTTSQPPYSLTSFDMAISQPRLATFAKSGLPAGFAFESRRWASSERSYWSAQDLSTENTTEIHIKSLARRFQ